MRVKRFLLEQRRQSKNEDWQIIDNKKLIGIASLYTIDLDGWCCKRCLMQFLEERSEDAQKICYLLCHESDDKFLSIQINSIIPGDCCGISVNNFSRQLPIKRFLIVSHLDLNPENRGRGLGRAALALIVEKKFNEGIEAIFLTPGPYGVDEFSESDIDTAIKKIAASYELIGFQSFFQEDMHLMVKTKSNITSETKLCQSAHP